jgi:ATP synthase subunit 6
MLTSPFEQFQIISIIPLSIGNFNISFTNSSLFMLIVVAAISGLFVFSLYEATLIPREWQSVAELSYLFILGLIREQIGDAGYKYLPLIFTTFMFLLTSNLLGMIPYTFTVTSHIIVTFGLALSIFIGIQIVAGIHHGWHFFSFFLPQGAPLALAPFLVLIEIMSYTFRVFSLAIRLFANMMSGHTLLKILAGFSWTMLSVGGFLYVLSVVPLLIIFALTGLELAIAFLQAYVFTILVCIYLNDSIHLH